MSLKDKILKALLDSKNVPISGEALAKENSVSRNAVWKAIRTLRSEGFEITSATNKGYCLVGGTDALSAAAVSCYLENRSLKVLTFDSIDSTNSEAKRIAGDNVTEPVLILAETQTGGRGRMGRSFFSPAKTGLYMSYLYRPEGSLSDSVAVTSAAAVAVVRAIKEVAGIDSGIKWVNDIYIGSKKVCGILTEAVTDIESGTAHCVIVGIGINVTTDDFPLELRTKAGALGTVKLDRNRLAAAVTNRLEALIKGLPERTFIDEYRRHSLVLGKQIVYKKNGRETAATAIGIDDNGALMVRNSDGTETTLNTGEISVRLRE